MGHLINPTALRVGWKKNWLDNIYAHHLNYPQLLHKVLRIRFFLNCFLIKPYMRKAAYLYSHISIDYNQKGLVANIFYYDGRLESSWYKLLDKLYITKLDQKHWKNREKGRNVDPTQRLNYDDSRNFFIFLLLYNWYNSNSILDIGFWKQRQLIFQNELHKPFASYKNKILFKRLGNKNQNLRFLQFLRLIQEFILKSSIENPKLITKGFIGVDFEVIAKRIFFLGYSLVVSNHFFEILSLYLKTIVCMYSEELNFETQFFVLTNNQITASFLAKYIAGRIGQNYNIKYLVNPLRKELRIVKKIARTQASNMLESIGGKRSNYDIQKNIFANLIIKYKTIQYNFLRNSKILLNFEQFCLLYNLKKNSDQLQVIGFAQTYFNKQLLIWLFLKIANSCQNSLYIFKNNSIKTWNWVDNYFFFRELYSNINDNYIGNSEILASNMPVFSIFKSGYLLRITIWGLIEYLKFNQLKNNIGKDFDLFKINKENLRRNNPELNGLRGFKFQFRGRFTRKQIAAAYCFVEGSIPLNTIKANVDYAFNTVAIKNSAIGIKVWLYREGEEDNYFLKVTN